MSRFSPKNFFFLFFRDNPNGLKEMVEGDLASGVAFHLEGLCVEAVGGLRFLRFSNGSTCWEIKQQLGGFKLFWSC